MFGQKKPEKRHDQEIRAFLENGCEFEGKMTFTGVVRLNGKFRGEIWSEDTLIIGETAQVEAKIHVGALIISGHVVGNAEVEERVEISGTGVFEGNIHSPILVTHEGAQIKGQTHIWRQEAADGSKELPKAG